MRLIRSCFFGCFAMLAAAVFFSMPASAFDPEPAFSSASFEMPDFALHDALAVEPAVAQVDHPPSPAANAHAVAFTVQNQPNTAWRFAVEAYSHIDPHIAIG